MQRVTSCEVNFTCHQLVSPAGKLPSRMFPIYKTNANQWKNLQFVAISNIKSGVICSFDQIDEVTHRYSMKPPNHLTQISVGMSADQFISISPNELIHGNSQSELITKLKNRFDRHSSNAKEIDPFFGLELAHFIEDEDLEIRCVKEVASKIQSVSEKVAKIWLQSAVMSTAAKAAASAQIDLNAYKKSQQERKPRKPYGRNPQNITAIFLRDFHREFGNILTFPAIKAYQPEDFSSVIRVLGIQNNFTRVILFATSSEWKSLKNRLPRYSNMEVFVVGTPKEKEFLIATQRRDEIVCIIPTNESDPSIFVELKAMEEFSK